MSEDWRTKAITDFCLEHNAIVIVDDEWKTMKKKVTLIKDKFAIIRRISYDAIPTLLPTALLNEMLNEIPADDPKEETE